MNSSAEQQSPALPPPSSTRPASSITGLVESPHALDASAWDGLQEAAPQSEAEHLAGLLAGFRLAAHRYAERTPLPERLRYPAPVSSAPPRPLRLFSAALACIALAIVLLFARAHPGWGGSSPHQAGGPPPASAPLSDEALLQGVQQDLAHTVPVSLQSLAIHSESHGETATHSLQ